jgi:hypothetical protein
MKYKVFISYATKDIQKVEPYLNIVKALPDTGCFFAKYDIEPNQNDREEILKNITNANVVFLFYSKHAKGRIYINQEIGVAVGLRKQIIIGKLDKTEPAGMLEGKNTLNFYNKREIPQEIARLVNFLQKEVNEHAIRCRPVTNISSTKQATITDQEAERIRNIIVLIMVLCAITIFIYCVTKAKKT